MSYALLLCASLIGLVAWPRHGLWARWTRIRKLATRVHQEDALKHILKQEARGQIPTLESVAGALRIPPNRAARLLEQMEDLGLITHASGRLGLEPRGRDLALHIIRSHRLWESYLAENTGLAEVSWHDHADRQEHLLTPAQADALSAQLGHPTHDPHGDAIPQADGVLAEEGGNALMMAQPDQIVRITHIEDEPPAIYTQLTAQGLRPGMLVRILDKSHQRIRLWAEGTVHVLTPILANNISIAASEDSQVTQLPGESHLSDLPVLHNARVAGLSPACRGQERRRLLDLGFVPGTPIEAEMVGPGGDPTAYRLRGTLIALRKEQASLIRIISAHPTA